MANYGQVSYGSKGSDVTELQKLLNSTGYGYNLSEDGIFGDNTLAAVQDYQKRSGLTVDGIVGTNTWGALTRTQTPAAQAPEQTAPAVQQEAPNTPTSASTPFTESDAAKQAYALVQQHLAQKPGEHQSTWGGELKDTIAQILNREKFSYDLNGDALYQQYKDQYVNQGKLAMMDTMGQAAAMTGGFGNSYAQSVGQQAYQGYLQQLNDKVPELYGMALDQYNREGQALYDQASLLAGMEEQEYSRYRDKLSDYYTELDRLTGDYRYLTEQEYGRYMDKLNIDYQQERDKVSDQQWQAAFDEDNRRYNQQTALTSGGGSSSSGGSGGSGGGYDSETASIQQQLKDAGYDIAVDGIWGPKTQAAYDDYNAGNGNPVNNNTSPVSDSIQSKAAGFTDNTDLANYLDGLVASGTITEEQADAMYAENKQVDRAALKDRSWTLQDDGGVNWLWGVDNNAVVKDQYGNTYRLDKLVDALVADGMSKSAAKDYVKKLQAKLGA